MASEVVNRPTMRQCPHPEAAKSRVEKAWRVWLGRYHLGTVYQLHPKGRWYALGPMSPIVDDQGKRMTFGSSNSAVQHLQGKFELHKPPRGKPEHEIQSPYLNYPRDANGYPELPPTE